MIREAVILAGGLGTRLRPLTLETPKILIPIAGRPFIEWKIEQLKQFGMEKFIFLVGSQDEKIIEYFNNRNDDEISVQCLMDSGKNLGTYRALIDAMPFLDDVFYLTYGDSYLSAKRSEKENVFLHSSASILMYLNYVKGSGLKGNIRIDNYRVSYHIEDEMNFCDYIDYGLMLVKREKLVESQARFFNLSEFFQALNKTGSIMGHIVPDSFYEIGSFEGKNRLENFLKGRIPDDFQ